MQNCQPHGMCLSCLFESCHGKWTVSPLNCSGYRVAAGGNGHQDWAAIPIGWRFRLGSTSPFLLLRQNGCLGCMLSGQRLKLSVHFRSFNCDLAWQPPLWKRTWQRSAKPLVSRMTSKPWPKATRTSYTPLQRKEPWINWPWINLSVISFGAQEIGLPMMTTYQTFRRGSALFVGKRLETTLTWWILAIWSRPFKDAGEPIAQGNAAASYQLPPAGARPIPWSHQESPGLSGPKRSGNFVSGIKLQQKRQDPGVYDILWWSLEIVGCLAENKHFHNWLTEFTV